MDQKPDDVATRRPPEGPGDEGVRRVGLRKLLVLGQVLLVCALLGTGILAGWLVASDRSLVEVAVDGPAASDGVARPDVAAATSMPDLRGLAERDARQVLADLGVDADVVSSEVQPAAGESGLVVSQEPVYGYGISDTVVLQVSEAATVPLFAGRPAEDVLRDLDELGAEVETVSRYAPRVTPGQVASIDPVPGTVLPVAVTVVISAEPDTVELADVSTTEGSCYVDDDTMNGSAFEPLLLCDASSDPTDLAWIIRRGGSRLTGMVGVPDSEDDLATTELTVVADNRTLATYTVDYGGEPQRIDLDVSGVLRLTLRYRSLTDEYGSIGLGGLRLVGDPRALNRLERS